MQMMGRILDVIVFVLAGAAFCREQTAAVNLLEIPKGEFIVSLGVLRLFVVDAQIPPAVFGKTVRANEFIFLLCGRPVLAPCIALVEYKFSFVDELFGMLKCPSVSRAMTAINFGNRFVGSLPITASLSLTDANARRGVRC